AQMIPYDLLDKVFLGHLHVDHFGDLGSFWIGGSTMNRLTPVRVWGPSGAEPKYGTKYALEKLKEAYVWDLATRSGAIDARGLELEVHEFDYKGVNKVVYEKNGVVIRSIPAIHGIDGAISYILEWNGLKFAYSSDTFPNKWWIEYTRGADIAIHECFLTPNMLVTKQGFTPLEGLVVGSLGHTSPQQFGKVMAETKPRLAVGYHFYNDFDTFPTMMAEIRKTYDGPVALAQDYMVFNITKKNILVRMSAINPEVWPQPAQRPKEPPKGHMLGFSEFINSGRVLYLPTLRDVWAEANREFGTDYKPLEVAKQLMGTVGNKGDKKPEK
ncbi:MAG: guanitoxin biosynthesis MBL fold metallo-hydrolase GntH, partial [Burkholderiales bacterium]